MSTRRSNPPRGRKSRRPEASPTDAPVTVPPPARAVDEATAQPRAETRPETDGELAAIEAGWDELLS